MATEILHKASVASEAPAAQALEGAAATLPTTWALLTAPADTLPALMQALAGRAAWELCPSSPCCLHQDDRSLRPSCGVFGQRAFPPDLPPRAEAYSPLGF